MNQFPITKVRVIDSHTGGEPTRTVIEGGPDLGLVSVAEQRKVFRALYNDFRRGVVCEPRGSDVMVGALLVPSILPDCAAGVIFFNNVGYLGMCGHGTIGVIATLAYLSRITPGEHKLETPVGVVTARLHDDGEVSVQNVPAYRYLKDVCIAVEGIGTVRGDVAWGGNWFFLVGEHGQKLELGNVEALTEWTWRVRQALAQAGVTGRDGQEIDHIELFAPSNTPHADSRNFVLCPGKAYDRSPCGTGTSAKLACLYADGKLREGEVWRQESIVGSVFRGSARAEGERIIPTIRGSAFVNAEATLIFNAADPFCNGIVSSLSGI